MMSESRKQKRKPYQKPEIKVIELAADEVLAGGGCKANSGGGSRGPLACFVDMANACFDTGS